MSSAAVSQPAPLSQLTLPVLASIWSRFQDNHVLHLPHMLLADISEHLSPWQLFTSRHLFENRDISVAFIWHKLYKKRWPYLFQKSRDTVFDSNVIDQISSSVIYSQYTDGCQASDTADNRSKYIEKHFLIILSHSLSTKIDESSEMGRKILTAMHSPYKNGTHKQRSTRDMKEHKLITCACLDPEFWIPHIRHLYLRPRYIPWVIHQNTLDMLECIKTLHFIGISESNFEQAVTIVEHLLQKGSLERLLVAGWTVTESHWRQFLQVCAGNPGPCHAVANQSNPFRDVTCDVTKAEDAYACSDLTEGQVIRGAAVRDENNDNETSGSHKKCDVTEGRDRTEQDHDVIDDDLYYAALNIHSGPGPGHSDTCSTQRALPCLAVRDPLDRVFCQALTHVLPHWPQLSRLALNNCDMDIHLLNQLARAVAKGHIRQLVLDHVYNHTHEQVGGQSMYGNPYEHFLSKVNEFSPHSIAMDDLTFSDVSYIAPTYPGYVLRSHVEETYVKKLTCKSIQLKGCCCAQAITDLLASGELTPLSTVLKQFSFERSSVDSILLRKLVDSLSTCSNLESISLSDTKLNKDMGTSFVGRLGNFKNLRTLNLSSCFTEPSIVADNVFMKAIAEVRTLRVLDVSHNRLCQHACALLDGLVDTSGFNTTSLRVLILASNCINVNDVMTTISRILARRQREWARTVLNALDVTYLTASQGHYQTPAQRHRIVSAFAREYDVSFVNPENTFADYVAMM